MDPARIEEWLKAVASGECGVAEALASLQGEVDLGRVVLDTDRPARTGFPEVVYGASKSPADIAAALVRLRAAGQPALATRVDAAKAAAVGAELPDLEWHPEAGILVASRRNWVTGRVAVVSAGTSDAPVASEATVVLEALGAEVDRVDDVGVAGLHRLLRRIDRLRASEVVIVVAGMDGALPSVVAGLVDRPVVAVPTSVGYGAAFGGLAPLLTMLNSCAPGVVVVNIDNGFGAAAAAIRMLPRGGGR